MLNNVNEKKPTFNYIKWFWGVSLIVELNAREGGGALNTKLLPWKSREIYIFLPLHIGQVNAVNRGENLTKIRLLEYLKISIPNLFMHLKPKINANLNDKNLTTLAYNRNLVYGTKDINDFISMLEARLNWT